jgi:hypothetical protein
MTHNLTLIKLEVKMIILSKKLNLLILVLYGIKTKKKILEILKHSFVLDL